LMVRETPGIRLKFLTTQVKVISGTQHTFQT
jgi:hypothetical protein